jgi:hypothetical protein
VLRALLFALPCFAGAAVVHWWARPRTSIGTRRRFPVITVSLLLVLTAVVAWPVLRRHQLERRLSGVASELAGRQVTVRCTSGIEESTKPGAELGSVAFSADGRPANQAVLADGICSDLQARRWGLASHVLAHEVAHLTGLLDEGRAECHAVQIDVRTAVLLGASPTQAQAAARAYYRDSYPQLPDDYGSAECRSGGALDEHLADPPWASRLAP